VCYVHGTRNALSQRDYSVLYSCSVTWKYQSTYVMLMDTHCYCYYCYYYYDYYRTQVIKINIRMQSSSVTLLHFTFIYHTCSK